jgi:hypothetical protein
MVCHSLGFSIETNPSICVVLAMDAADKAASSIILLAYNRATLSWILLEYKMEFCDALV